MPENIWNQYRDKLAGGWKLISYEVFDGNGPDKKPVAKPHGDAPLGRVLLSPNGFLSAHMSKPDRVNKQLPSGKSWVQGDDGKVAHVARGHSTYCGYLELFADDDGELWWQTRVEVSSDPSRMGGLEVRRVRYLEEGDKAYMVLQPEKDMVLEVGATVAIGESMIETVLTDDAGRHEDAGCAEMGEVRVDRFIMIFAMICVEEQVYPHVSTLCT